MNAYIDATRTNPQQAAGRLRRRRPRPGRAPEVDRCRRRLHRRPHRRHLRQGRRLRGERTPTCSPTCSTASAAPPAMPRLPPARRPERPAGADHDHRQVVPVRRAHQPGRPDRRTRSPTSALTGGPQNTSAGCAAAPAPHRRRPRHPAGRDTRARRREEHHRLAQGHAQAHEQRTRRQRLADDSRATRSRCSARRCPTSRRRSSPSSTCTRPTTPPMGASFPGTGLVELGRGQDYAWSATSAEQRPDRQRAGEGLQPRRRGARGQRRLLRVRRRLRAR